MRRVLAILAALLCLPLTSSSNYHDPLEWRLIERRLNEIIHFVEAETGYHAGERTVRVFFASPKAINRAASFFIFFGDLEKAKELEELQPVIAMYIRGSDHIFLPSWFKLGMHDDILAHEVTHWLQDINDAWSSCRNELEAEAYRVQVAFIERFGIWEPGRSGYPYENTHLVCDTRAAP